MNDVMETNNTLDFIGAYIIPMITAAVGWLVGTRKRKNDFLQDLQASIDLLSSENKKLLADITSVNAEIVAVRKENEELKASVDKLCSENSQLKEEIRQLKDKIHNR
jgi:peptidoglycan hydrolase CwlO-like protein